MIIPPFAGVALVEYRDRIALTPICWCREFVGLGRFDSRQVGPQPGEPLHPMFSALMKGKKIWVIVAWRQYEDGTEEPLRIHHLDPRATKRDAHRTFEDEVRFIEMPKDELVALSKLFKTTPDDLAYTESRHPNIQTGKGSIEESDLYQARLKALAGLQPKTVELIQKADAAADDATRQRYEREAVHALFADLAHYWPDDVMKEWQRRNPIGAEWMTEFSRVRSEPRRKLDPVNLELALNWIRQKYNLLTAEELSDAVFRSTGKRVSAAAIKKRRERLGLTTKRPSGPRPNSER